MIFAKLRAIEQATGNSQVLATFFVGEDRLMMQNAGELRLTHREYETCSVALLVAAFMSADELSVELEGWQADYLKFKFVRWAYDMNIREALDAELGPDQGSLAVLDQTGDTKVIWDRNNPVEVEIARAAFDKAKAKKYMAYKIVGQDGKKGEVISEFDPKAERIILAPVLVGG